MPHAAYHVHHQEEQEHESAHSEARLNLLTDIHLVDDRCDPGYSDNFQHVQDSPRGWYEAHLLERQGRNEINRKHAEHVVFDNLLLLEYLFAVMVVIRGVQIDDNVQDEKAGSTQVDVVVVSIITELLINLRKRQSERDRKRVEDGDYEDQNIPGELNLIIGPHQEVAREDPLGECRFFSVIRVVSHLRLLTLVALGVGLFVLGLDGCAQLLGVQTHVVHKLDLVRLPVKLTQTIKFGPITGRLRLLSHFFFFLIYAPLDQFLPLLIFDFSEFDHQLLGLAHFLEFGAVDI